MCDQTEISYLPGDVVWVKLGPVWWPGVVCNNEEVPHEIIKNLRKTPLAIVKFFQEEQFEYVHKLSNIYHYNCLKKNDFIRKGLDMFRSKNRDAPSNMKLFPEDVARAEVMTGGNPNILRDERFQPEEKPQYTDLFATTVKKISKKSKLEIKKKPPPCVQPSTPRIITHPRFLKLNAGIDIDYETRERQQVSNRECDDEPPSIYHCPDCDFFTARLNVIVLHNKTHSRSANHFSVPNKAVKRKYNSSSLVLENKKQRMTNDDRGSVKTTPQTPTSNGAITFTSRKRGRPKKIADVKSLEKVSTGRLSCAMETATTITTSQLAAPKPENVSESKTDEIQESLLEDWAEYEEQEVADNTNAIETSSVKMQVDDLKKSTVENEKNKKSCFDFDDSEDHLIIDKSKIKFGRKIPRVLDEKTENDTKSECLNFRVETSETSVDEITRKKEEADTELSKKVEKLIEDVSTPTVLPEIPRSVKKEQIKMYNASLAQQASIEERAPVVIQNETVSEEIVLTPKQNDDSPTEQKSESEPILTSVVIQNEVEVEINNYVQSEVTCESEPLVQAETGVIITKTPPATEVVLSTMNADVHTSSPKRTTYRLATIPKIETINSSISKSNSSCQIAKPVILQTSVGKILSVVNQQAAIPSSKYSVVLMPNAKSNTRTSRLVTTPTMHLTPTTSNLRISNTQTPAKIVTAIPGKSPSKKAITLTPDAIRKLFGSQPVLKQVLLNATSAVAPAASQIRPEIAAENATTSVTDNSKDTMNFIVDSSGNLIAENAATSKKEDILAKALEDTDVLQMDITTDSSCTLDTSHATQSTSTMTSVYESVTLNTPPIMSSFEIPSRTLAVTEIIDNMIVVSDENVATTATAEYIA